MMVSSLRIRGEEGVESSDACLGPGRGNGDAVWTCVHKRIFGTHLSLVFPEGCHTFFSPRGFSLAVGNLSFLPKASSPSCYRCPQRPGYQHFPDRCIRY